MKSIDEGVIDFAQSPPELRQRELLDIGREIKQRLRYEIGCYMRCNVGIGTNRFLAKTAAGLSAMTAMVDTDTFLSRAFIIIKTSLYPNNMRKRVATSASLRWLA
jgi:DNA polymerase-4